MARALRAPKDSSLKVVSKPVPADDVMERLDQAMRDADIRIPSARPANSWTIGECVIRWGISEYAVRRKLGQLYAKGQLERVFGGREYYYRFNDGQSKPGPKPIR